MAEQKEEKMEEKGMECCHCHQKATPRSEKERKQLQNRLSRMSGQLNGISRMLEENRYCGDILTGSCRGECFTGLWLCNPEGTYGDLCGGRDPEGEYCYSR